MLKIGDKAPDFSLSDKDGRTVTLSELFGKSYAAKVRASELLGNINNINIAVAGRIYFTVFLSVLPIITLSTALSATVLYTLLRKANASIQY